MLYEFRLVVKKRLSRDGERNRGRWRVGRHKTHESQTGTIGTEERGKDSGKTEGGRVGARAGTGFRAGEPTTTGRAGNKEEHVAAAVAGADRTEGEGEQKIFERLAEGEEAGGRD